MGELFTILAIGGAAFIVVVFLAKRNDKLTRHLTNKFIKDIDHDKSDGKK